MEIALSLTALLFAISGFVLGLLAFIKTQAREMSTHTVQYQPAQEDLSSFFEDLPKNHGDVRSVRTEDLEKTLLQGLD